jgi:hypothetical protein
MFDRRFFVRDGALVGDFRDSLQPMVWRMELSRVHAVGFKVRQASEVWELGAESSSGAFTPITSFATQGAANLALRGILTALRRSSGGRRVWRILLGFVLSVLVLWFALSAAPKIYNSLASSSPQIELGKPLSADQALRPPPAAQ